jgi:hypothetical protein
LPEQKIVCTRVKVQIVKLINLSNIYSCTHQMIKFLALSMFLQMIFYSHESDPAKEKSQSQKYISEHFVSLCIISQPINCKTSTNTADSKLIHYMELSTGRNISSKKSFLFSIISELKPREKKQVK